MGALTKVRSEFTASVMTPSELKGWLTQCATTGGFLAVATRGPGQSEWTVGWSELGSRAVSSDEIQKFLEGVESGANPSINPASPWCFERRQVGENDFKEELIFFLRSPLSDGDKSRIGCASCQFELLLLRARNEHDSRRRDLFLGLVSHELKTPLTAISGVLQLLSRDDARLKSQLPDAGVFLDRRQHFNEVLQRQVLRLTELIDGLLDLSRIRMGRFGVDPIRCNISDILRNAVMPRLTLAASESLLQLRLESPDLLEAVADPIRIEELIVNLGMQAIRFSPEGAIVWMRLYVDSDRKEWVLRVRDQGKPWPSEDRERLFLPYETAERGGRMGGAGLGLYLARQIAQLHGGQVQWLSPNGQFGNQLEARMPLVAPSPLQSSS